MSKLASRKGKVARLPKDVRDRLNQQIRDGVPGKDLVQWLNRLPEVRDVLLEHFNARDITEQNLSEWKLGGYQDWLAHQDRLDWVRRMSDEAQDIHLDAGLMPWMERVGAIFELALGKVVDQQLSNPVESPEQIQQLMDLSREISRHRRLSQDAAKWREHLGKAAALKSFTLDDQILDARMEALTHLTRSQSLLSLERHFTDSLSPEQRTKFEALLKRLTLQYLEGKPSPGFAEPSDPTKSD